MFERSVLQQILAMLLMMTVLFSCAKKGEIVKEEAGKEVLEVAIKTVYEDYFEYLDDSFPDLPWLKNTVEETRTLIKAGYFEHRTIHQCTYKNGIGFILNSCVECMDLGVSLFNLEGEFLCSEGGWVGSCRDFSIDYETKKLIWEIQPDPPLTIQDLYEQPLDVINKSVQGKWKLHKLWDGVNHFYDWSTIVYISEKGVIVSGNEGINFSFSYGWKKMEVPGPYPNTSSYTTYVMWNDKQHKGEWSFCSLRNDMLEVNLFNLGVYTLIRVRDNTATVK